MEREIGTISRGMHCPIIRKGGDLAAIAPQSVLSTAEAEDFKLRNRDVITVTESTVARAQGNYVLVGAVVTNVEKKLGGETTGVMFPILSRNRFAICLKGIAKGAKKAVLMFSCLSDKAGNELVSVGRLDEVGINPYSDVLSLETYRKLLGENRHGFIGIDYMSYYGDLTRSCDAGAEIIFANRPKEVLKYTRNVLTYDIYTRARTKRILKASGTERVHGLDDIMIASVDRPGYNRAFGLLGSNESTEGVMKLFPRNCQLLIQDIQKQVLQTCGKHAEAVVHGNGAFKDPIGKVWELANPRVSPVYTPGLEGASNELKLRYLADNDLAQPKGEELQKAVETKVCEKEGNLVGNMASQGATPRRLTDLIDSFCDPTSGFRDKGAPVALVQGYFDNFTNQRVSS